MAGYYDALAVFLDNTVTSGFMQPQHRDMLIVETDPEKLLARFETYEAPTVSKWIKPGQQ